MQLPAATSFPQAAVGCSPSCRPMPLSTPCSCPLRPHSLRRLLGARPRAARCLSRPHAAARCDLIPSGGCWVLALVPPDASLDPMQLPAATSFPQAVVVCSPSCRPMPLSTPCSCPLRPHSLRPLLCARPRAARCLSRPHAAARCDLIPSGRCCVLALVPPDASLDPMQLPA